MALAQRTLDLVNIASESRSEADLYRYVLGAVPLEQAYSDGESVLFAKRTGKPRSIISADARRNWRSRAACGIISTPARSR